MFSSLTPFTKLHVVISLIGIVAALLIGAFVGMRFAVLMSIEESITAVERLFKMCGEGKTTPPGSWGGAGGGCWLILRPACWARIVQAADFNDQFDDHPAAPRRTIDRPWVPAGENG